MSDRQRRPGASILPLLVVAVLAAAGLTMAGVLPSRWSDAQDPVGGALDVAPPVRLPSPDVRAPQPVLSPDAAGPVVRAGAVRDQLKPLLRDRSVRRHVGVAVADLATGRVRWHNLGSSLARERFTPASTAKLFTAAAALEVLGPAHRFATSVVRVPGRGTPRLVLVGGGDPLLVRRAAPGAYPVPATLTGLAARTAQALRRDGVRRVRLGYDAALFSGPAASPTWEPSYLPDDVVSPVSALWVDEGRRPGSGQRSADPAKDASDAFAAALERRGVRVDGPVRTGSGDGGTRLAQVWSAPLDQVVAHTLETSDNEAAEVLLRHVAVGTGRAGSFLGGAAAVRETLTGLGVPMGGVVLWDGSGLSRTDRVSVPAVLSVLALAATGDDSLRSVETGLSVAGFNGSLSYRFTSPAARAGLGTVRAKTGTLTGVHALAGVLVDRDGRALAFVALADRVPVPLTLDARDQLDEVAAALAACGCR